MNGNFLALNINPCIKEQHVNVHYEHAIKTLWDDIFWAVQETDYSVLARHQIGLSLEAIIWRLIY